MDLLEFAEKAGEENIKFHVESAECLAKESNTTLTILLAGAGASLGYWMKLLELGNHPYLSWGAAAICIYLFALAFSLLQGGMKIEDIQPPTNEPKNLTLPGLTLEDVRGDELKNLQWRIDQNSKRNEKKAKWLNWIRLAATAAPIVFAIGCGLGAAFA